MLLSAVKDKSYRTTPLGQLVGRYIRWCRNERGLSPETIRAWEGMLARMSMTHPERLPGEITLDDLRLVIDLWADREPRHAQERHRGDPPVLQVGERGGLRRRIARYPTALPEDPEADA